MEPDSKPSDSTKAAAVYTHDTFNANAKTQGIRMAKLTLSFKDRKLKVFALQSGECLIGRDPGCAIPIDSLAVEPRHACIRLTDENVTVEPASENARVHVNGQGIAEATQLNEGDQILIGKHTLSFSEESQGTVLESSVVTVLPSTGWMQIQSGSHLGRTIRLDKAFTRVGKPDGDLAIIAHREDGYYLSHLQGEQFPRINNRDIGEETRILHNGDAITVGELQVQFFSDAGSAQSSEVPVTEQEEKQQRKFSRIPFDVSVTLSADRQSWETELVDLSLHGALIKTPADFVSDTEQIYQLAIHLEGGPDIRMEATVAHQEHEELGLQCKDIDVDSITHLRRLVELNLGDPELLERELSALG